MSTVASQPVDPAAPGPDDPSGSGEWVVELSAALPGRCLALALPLLAFALVGVRAATAGLARAAEDPLPPAVVAAATVVGAGVLGWRAWTQRARLDASGLRVRNLTVSFDLTWDQVERLQLERRLGLQVVEIRMRHLRRRHRLGAATRVVGPTADAVRVALGTHPDAGQLLDDTVGDDRAGDRGDAGGDAEDDGDDVTGTAPGAP